MILLALNELNLEFLQGYIREGKLKNFQTMLEKGAVHTTSENSYELLEPWIQWVTMQTGKSYEQHQIFRLGDIVERKDLNQIFEVLEDDGLSIGAVSPFNADNRLKDPKFFIPDPWTQTRSSGGFLIGKLSRTISRFVNNNASGKNTYGDLMWLMLGFMAYVRVKRWIKFFKLVLNRNKPGAKAAILDMILLEVFVTLQNKHNPDYSHLFFNGVAHVQHHYMFNSSQYKGSSSNPEWYCPSSWDPVLMMLETYDAIVGDLLETGKRIIAVTALHQVPAEDKIYYWRPVAHRDFLKEAGVNGDFSVIPRMSRDFLIQTSSDDHATQIEEHLNQFVDSSENKPVFNVDNRGDSLFVEIIFGRDLDSEIYFIGPNEIKVKELKSKLAFVAIKNGKHHGLGYIFSNQALDLPEKVPLKDVFDYIRVKAVQDAGLAQRER